MYLCTLYSSNIQTPICWYNYQIWEVLIWLWADTDSRNRDLFLTKETLYPWAISAIVERETGVEPATFSLEGWRSTNWATPALICGESRIRTCEVKNSRFTVCPRWPLEYLPKNHYLKEPSRWRDSNPRPADYKSAALASWATSAYAKKKPAVKADSKCKYLFFQTKQNK